MNNEELRRRCEALERNAVQSLRIDELERELLRRDLKKLMKKRDRQRAERLKMLAEVDQLSAEVSRQIELRGLGS